MKPLLFLCLLAVAAAAVTEIARAEVPPFTRVPGEFAGRVSPGRSPLILDDGATVKTAKEWRVRRGQIVKAWTDIMGAWPEVLRQPQVEVLETRMREGGVTQRRVRVEIAPGQMGEGYVLLPAAAVAAAETATDAGGGGGSAAKGNGASGAAERKDEPGGIGAGAAEKAESPAGTAASHAAASGAKVVAGKYPAVFVPFYDPETSAGLNGKPLRDFAWQLARRGFVTLCIGSPGGDARKPVLCAGARCQPLAYLGYVSANMWQVLANLPEVDAGRIGIVGHSYGGKWSLFGACLWEKYACAVWSDPGVEFDESRASINYQEPWYLGLDAALPPGAQRKPGLVSAESPRTGAYKVLIEQGHHLPELMCLMAPRPFLVSGGAEDPPKRWLALNHVRAVNELLGVGGDADADAGAGAEGRVAMTNREKHDPNEESNEVVYRFLERWLGR